MDLENAAVLSIETGIQGGSLSLFVNGNELDSWTGDEKVSKAEEVLEQISELLKKNKVCKSDLGMIAVSSGPGSSTGVKIGLAIAAGLGNALGIRVLKVSAFEALLDEEDFGVEDRVVAVLPIGKKMICSQVFESSIKLNPKDLESFRAVSVEEFNNQLKSIKYNRLVFHQKAFKVCESIFETNGEAKKLSRIAVKNLAFLMAKRVTRKVASDNNKEYTPTIS